MKKAVKLLRGSVCVRAKSAYPERMLNLCSARGIEFWDVRDVYKRQLVAEHVGAFRLGARFEVRDEALKLWNMYAHPFEQRADK